MRSECMNVSTHKLHKELSRLIVALETAEYIVEINNLKAEIKFLEGLIYNIERGE